MVKVGQVTRNKGAISGRKAIKRKPKDSPKRPLSAYNYFFQEERRKIIEAINCEDKIYQKEIDPHLDEELIEKLRQAGGRVCFAEVGRIIGRRWKDVSDNRLAYCKSLAENDKNRYELELETCEQKLEIEKMRNTEADNMSFRNSVHVQENPHMHPFMPQRYPEMPTPPSVHYDAGQTGYMPYCHMTSNAHGQMSMIDPFNPHYASALPPINEGRYGNAVSYHNNNYCDNRYSNESYNLNVPVSSPSFHPRRTYSSYSPDARSSEQHSYSQHAPHRNSAFNEYQASVDVSHQLTGLSLSQTTNSAYNQDRKW